MFAHSSAKSASRRILIAGLATLAFLADSGQAQTLSSQNDTPPKSDSPSTPVNKKSPSQPAVSPRPTPVVPQRRTPPSRSALLPPQQNGTGSQSTSGATQTQNPTGSEPTVGSTQPRQPRTNSDSNPTSPQKAPTRSQPTTVPASQRPSTKAGHPTETNPGHTPHGSDNGPAIGAAAGAATAVVLSELIAHHHASPQKLGHDGPQIEKEFDMSDFTVKGLVRASWPVVLDFTIDSPGAVFVEITAAKRSYRVRMTNQANRRGYAIIHLPANFGTSLQPAVYHIHSVAPAGANTPAPRLRTYGLGAGDKAVGSVAIDQLTFRPAIIHPKANEVADYGFHAHSAFDGVRAEFIFTTLNNGRVLVQKDQEEKLSPIPEGERAKGTWKGQGKAGEHMLQIRAWRGLENGGDWVVAWSPEIVDVIK